MSLSISYTKCVNLKIATNGHRDLTRGGLYQTPHLPTVQVVAWRQKSQTRFNRVMIEIYLLLLREEV